MKNIFFILKLISIWFVCCGFVFERNPPAKVDVTPENPEFQFHVAAQMPPLENKEDLNPQWANLEDNEFWMIIVDTAATYWNRVDASFVRIATSDSRDGTYDASDKKFSIVGSDDLAVTSAADALPIINGKNKIEDCDIRFPNSPQNALSAAYTLIHEMGHCLGIGHNHIDTNSIMSYNTNINSLALGAQDMAALIYLYPHPSYDKAEQNFIPCGVVAGTQSIFLSQWLLVLPLLLAGIHAGVIKTKRRSRKNF